SLLHFPYEEYILGYLKFSAKGTKQKVFGMLISNELIIADIQGEQYYKEYLEKVDKHQRYLASEEGSDPDSPAPKPAKATKKSKPSAPKANLRPPATKPASSQQPKPKPAPAKSQEKKRKLVTKTSDKLSPAKRSKLGLVTKRRKPTSSLRSVDESVDKSIPEKEPRFDDEVVDIQSAVEESLKSVCTSGSAFAGGLTDSDSKFDEEVPPVVKVGAQDEGQARPNPGVLTEGQAGSNPSDDAKPSRQSNPVVHAGPNHEHMDLEATDVSTYQHPDFGDLFFNDKPSEVENEKTTAETEAKSMVSVIIQQDMSAIPPMTTPKEEKRHDSSKTSPGSPPHQPPPPPPPVGPFGTLGSLGAFRSSQLPPPPPPLSTSQSDQTSVLSIPEDLHMDDDMALNEQVQSSDDEDTENAHILKVNLQQDWWKPLKEDRSATLEPA
nr:E-beta-farnesene synthase [Tanacetum cinerariifolium]